MPEAPRLPALSVIAESVEGTILLLTFRDARGNEYSAAAVSGPAVDSAGNVFRLDESRGTGLKLTSFKVVEP